MSCGYLWMWKLGHEESRWISYRSIWSERTTTYLTSVMDSKKTHRNWVMDKVGVTRNCDTLGTLWDTAAQKKDYSRNCSWKAKKRKPEKAWAHDIISTDKHELATSTSKNSWDSSKWRETIHDARSRMAELNFARRRPMYCHKWGWGWLTGVKCKHLAHYIHMTHLLRTEI